MNNPLFFYTKNIVFQEVPNEISLAFSIAGCKNNCKNCSWKSCNIKSKPLTDELYLKYLKKYKDTVSCVLFLGGEWNKEDLINKLKLAKQMGYKTCLYTGLNDVSSDIKSLLNYLKTGPYIEELGGLNSPTTNQRFLDLINNKILNKYFIHQEAF